MSRTALSVAAASLAALLLLGDSRAGAASAPRLAVILVVDQMRADYIDRFRRDWTGGLERIVAHGAWFTNAAYPYLTTVTCSGHATIATGAFPHVHGIFQNAWWDRESARQIPCTDDARAAGIGYSTGDTRGDSGRLLLTTTLADELRTRRSARVVSLSVKDRSAIMLAGHGGDAVTWLSTAVDGWMTSSAFTATPVPAVKAFVDANPIDADFGRSWTRLLPAARYPEPDAAIGEKPPRGWTPLFPHVLTGTNNRPDADYHAQWERSPFADAYVGRFATALAESLRLGRHEGTDVLAVSFASPDLVGHAFGPDSQETRDVYARLDRTIGALLSRLDALVGRDQYVLALTSDHGVTRIPDQLKASGQDGGQISPQAVIDAIERRAQTALGSGKYVNRSNNNDVYFEPDMYDRLVTAPAALAAVLKALAEVPGIARAFGSGELRDAEHQPDALARAAALTYYPGRSGDIVLAPKAGWIFGTNATNHGSASPDDQRVPILFMGRGIRPGRYGAPATPADVAPTLAAVCGVTLPHAEGHALRAALRATSVPPGGDGGSREGRRSPSIP